jgi:hypothetical protein
MVANALELSNRNWVEVVGTREAAGSQVHTGDHEVADICAAQRC